MASFTLFQTAAPMQARLRATSRTLCPHQIYFRTAAAPHHHPTVSLRCAGAPMDTGLLVGARVLCPWHNAAFSVVTGAGIDMPARDALDSYPVEVRRRAQVLNAAGGRHRAAGSSLLFESCSYVLLLWLRAAAAVAAACRRRRRRRRRRRCSCCCCCCVLRAHAARAHGTPAGTADPRAWLYKACPRHV